MNCGVIMTKPTSYSLKQWENKKYCSPKCGASSPLHKNFVDGHKHSNATKKKLSLQKIGNKNPNWKGGRNNDGNGYYRIRSENGKYQLEHRYIMEKHLGRELKKSEHVHHIDGDRGNNDLGNLELMSKKDHINYHSKKNTLYKGCQIPNCDRNHRASGLCAYHYNDYKLKGLV